VTVGEECSSKIAELFASNEYVLACLLDEVASQGAERVADLTQQRYGMLLQAEGLGLATVVERYSPGYCGWHVSSQAPLFGILDPSAIGLRLNDRFLMEPLKSISGVFIAGKEEIHSVNDSFAFCKKCATERCRQRRPRPEPHASDLGRFIS
jgi:cobalamin-dependent methionine synthase I